MKACLLDIDGTLVSTGGAGRVAFAETFADLFDVDEITAEVSFAGRSDRAIATDLMAHHGIEATDDNWAAFQVGYLNRLGAALERCDGEVLPGVVELIDNLESRGDILIGLLTGNILSAARSKLSYYGLWGHFKFGGFGDHHLDRNDIARAAVAEAERHYTGAPNGQPTIVVVGDTPNDVRCARSVNAKAVAVPTGDSSAAALRLCGPDLVIDTLEDHRPILDWFL